MTTIKENFSQEEWRAVLSGPGQAGVYLMAASPSGPTGLLAESRAITEALRDVVRENPQGELLSALALDYHYEPEAVQQHPEPAASLEEVRDRAFAAVRGAVWLVATKTSEADQLEYKQLILNVAWRVATAATEGGFLGIGGTLVSDEERTALRTLQEELGLPDQTDSPDGMNAQTELDAASD